MSATGLQAFNGFIMNEKTQSYLNTVVGERKESFVANVISVVSSNTALQECTPSTVMYAALKATALDLPLDQNLGFAYVLPYNNKGKKEASLQLGYKSFIQLAQRTGQFVTINVSDVRQGELSSMDRLTGEYTFEWNGDDEREGLGIIGYVAYFKLSNGFEKSMYMSIAELESHGKKYSKTYAKGYGPWKDMKDAMCKKTVLKLLLSKYAPLSIENQMVKNLGESIVVDQAVIRSENEIEYIDNDVVDEEKIEKVNGLFEDAEVEEPQENS